MPLAGLADPVDPWQRIQVKEEVEVSYRLVIIAYGKSLIFWCLFNEYG